MMLLGLWLSAFVVTQAIEAPIYAVAIGRHSPQASAWERVVGALVPSALTHPLVWFIWPPLFQALPVCVDPERMLTPDCFLAYTVWAEFSAWAIEWGVLASFGVRRAWLWSAVANGLSFGFGALVVG
jgi:hypothetical protein